MNIFSLEHAKVLYLRFCAIYDYKFVKIYHDEDFKSLWANEWSSALSTINPNVIKDSLDYCKKNLDWPPSIAEFIKICESHSGVPSLDESINFSTRREFKHPIVLMCYEKVGSWSMKNDSAKELRIKFGHAYIDSLNKFREDAADSWQYLEDYNAKAKELPSPSKIPSTSESKAFRECMNKCQELLQSKKIAGGGKTYKEYDAYKIKKGHAAFEQSIFDEYKTYLMSIHETETMILPPAYAYDRMRFIAQREQPELLRQQGFVPPTERSDDTKSSGRRNNGPQKVYKAWIPD